ncbi:hypothetical protein B0H16DRAFT_1697194 [Mycena metata]|uniref:Uncharacterized protein n=1 Tax=Mycena metata TaxID=1033252 RepID=A0AAD7HXQ4_9AGAR|nr:hypothetical protein B0H16DRAFT_1893864 [Mycena metata]KAJ7729469.1 hypothetical protein B0H16DRAFT_1697194 [Mycena metata]
MSPTIEVSYTAEDVNVLKPKLIALVQRQVSKWPGGDFKPRDKKLTVAILQEVLLNPSYGFTKQVTESSPPLSPQPDDSRDGSMQGSAHRSPDPEFEEKWVELLIEDTRTSSKTIQPVCLWVCDNLGCKEGEWRADSKDLLLELQTSISPLAGSFKLGYQSSVHPDYRIYFIKVTTETPWNETVASVPCVTIPATNTLKIFVEPAETDPGTFNSCEPTIKPLEVARHRANTSDVSGPSIPSANADIEWLKEEIKTLEGYAHFTQHRHKVQQNVGVIESWRFIALVSKTYSGKLSHVPGRSGRPRKIKKSSMHKALGLSSSAFTQAENAVRILNIYGEGGSKPAQEVIAETEIRLEKPEGAKVLYPFLVEWEKDNS